MTIFGWYLNGWDIAILLTIPVEVWIVFWVIGPAQDRRIKRKARKIVADALEGE